MKKLLRKWNDLFSPKEMQGLDGIELLNAFNDPLVRKIWLLEVYDGLKRLNLELDKQLLSGSDFRIPDLCARRKAYQDILEAILSAKRQAGHNPADKSGFDLDAVTA